MAASRTVVTSDIGRVFVQNSTGLLGCCPTYLGCVGLSGISQDRTEAITIKCLSDKKSGEYELVDKIPGTLNELTFDLTSYLGINGISVLRSMFQNNCPVVLHVHFGTCTNPQNFTEFQKAIVLDNVLFNSYSTGDLISLDYENVSVVEETTSAEAESTYEFFSSPNFSLVAKIDETEPFDLHLIEGEDCGSLCAFCANCTLQDCTEDFFTIPQDEDIVASFSSGQYIYTIEDDGSVKVWNYPTIAEGELSCTIATTLTLDTGETVTAAAMYGSILVAGTSDGDIIFYNIRTGEENVVFTADAAVAHVTANEHGYLVADVNGGIYYSSAGQFWSDSTTTPAGAVTALLLYSSESWLVATNNAQLYYTNDSGDNYTLKPYPSVTGDPIKQFAQSNASVLHAINDTYYYQSYDAGCNWHFIDLEKYFSSLFSIVVCPTNPFVVYLAGLAVDGLSTYVVKVNFGA